MKTLFTLLASALLLASCNKTSIRGSGNTITETRTVQAFTGVKVQGSFTVDIRKGNQPKVEVKGYENLVSIFQTFISNGTLVLKFNNDYYNIRNNNITVLIEVPDIEHVIVDGSGTVGVSNLNGNSFTATINGSGTVNSLNCSYVNARYSVNGSGDIHAAQIAAVNADVDVNGSGKVDVFCSQKLKATIHGSGDINYWGNPQVVETNVSGSGRVRKK
jgi:predicted small secreted protein